MKDKVKNILEKFLIFRPFLWLAFLYHGERNLYEKKKQIEINRNKIYSEEEKIQIENGLNWTKINGDNTLRIEYDLKENSIVFDVGGFEGNWAAEILARYNSNVYIFEPYIPYYEKIENRFKKNTKVKSYQFGLGGQTRNLVFYLDNDASSTIIQPKVLGNEVNVELVNIVDFISKENITNVNLIKLNIEGGEYELMESLIENNLLPLFDNFQIQFHTIDHNSNERKEYIRTKLNITHQLTYQYEYYWENWKKR